MLKLIDTLMEQETVVAQLRGGLKAFIEGCPDNPDIKRLSDNCFILRSSKLGNNWTPEYHDFKYQYRVIAGRADELSPVAFLSFLSNVISTGKHYDRNHDRNRTIYFHPEVITNIKAALGV
jgi:hypothetical protein